MSSPVGALTVLLSAAVVAACSGGSPPMSGPFVVHRVEDPAALVISGRCGYDAEDHTSSINVNASGGRVEWSVSRPVAPDGSWTITIPLDGEDAGAVITVHTACSFGDTVTPADTSVISRVPADIPPIANAVVVDPASTEPLAVAPGALLRMRGACPTNPPIDAIVGLGRIVAPPAPSPGKFSQKYDPGELPWNTEARTSDGADGTWHTVLLIPSDAPRDDYTLSGGCTSPSAERFSTTISVR